MAIQCAWNLDPRVHWNATGEKLLVASVLPVGFQCVPIVQINTGWPPGHHWVVASASVVPVASQCNCGSSGLPVLFHGFHTLNSCYFTASIPSTLVISRLPYPQLLLFHGFHTLNSCYFTASIPSTLVISRLPYPQLLLFHGFHTLNSCYFTASIPSTLVISRLPYPQLLLFHGFHTLNSCYFTASIPSTLVISRLPYLQLLLFHGFHTLNSCYFTASIPSTIVISRPNCKSLTDAYRLDLEFAS